MERPIKSWQWLLLALVSGAISVFAFAPFGQAWALLLSLCGFTLLPQKNSREALLLGFLFGVGFFAANVHWIFVSIAFHGHGGVFVGLLVTCIFVAVLALYPAGVAWLVAKYSERNKWLGFLTVPFVWVLLEWVRGWFLSGFPWAEVGVAFIDSPLSGWLPVVGSLGVGLAAWATVLLLVALLSRVLSTQNEFALTDKKITLLTSVVLLVWVAGYGLQHQRWVSDGASSLNIALIQGNIPQDEKWLPENRDSTLAMYREMSDRFWTTADVIIWPETAIPDFLHYVEDFVFDLQEEGVRTQTELLVGVPVYDFDEARYYNTVMLVGQDYGFYSKQRLVPFGEFLPGRQLLGSALDFLGAPMADFTSGPVLQRPLSTKGVGVGVSICYEIAYADLIGKQSRDVGYLVTVSNDGWFGDTVGPHQHLQIARVRALEMQKPVVRATNTGISAVYDASGVERLRSPQFTRWAAAVDVRPTLGATPYARWGDWPVVGLCVFVLAVLGWRVRRSGSDLQLQREGSDLQL